ncbi:RTA1 like protein-domain-containing protein [Dactylonectria estremocensis]|uniref:RTA1 like protein-domain-containing protein n=1 Tax=Dactylonectria estremocensis TaxID=1079267 RepID=A0A9P9D557_9HYPO|nr:RTA1 like protein-domain-containing protein [Dactylonectria estremocensis]
MAANYYKYDPSLAAAITFIIGFTISSLMHIYQIVKTKTWFFIPFLIGSLFEIIGFVGRAIGAKQTPDWTFGPYVMQTLLLLLGPTCYAASIYMVLGRLIRLLNAEEYSLIRSSWLTKFFLVGDVLSIALQGIGGGKLVNAETEDERSTGEDIIIGGLVVQILFFSLFMAVTCLFHFRVNRKPTLRMSTMDNSWRRLLSVLYITSILILIRSIFRMIEYVMGHDSELQSKEVYIYVLDAAPMLIASALFNVFHPSRYLVSGKQLADATDSEMQLTDYDSTYRGE